MDTYDPLKILGIDGRKEIGTRLLRRAFVDTHNNIPPNDPEKQQKSDKVMMAYRIWEDERIKSQFEADKILYGEEHAWREAEKTWYSKPSVDQSGRNRRGSPVTRREAALRTQLRSEKKKAEKDRRDRIEESKVLKTTHALEMAAKESENQILRKENDDIKKALKDTQEQRDRDADLGRKRRLPANTESEKRARIEDDLVSVFSECSITAGSNKSGARISDIEEQSQDSNGGLDADDDDDPPSEPETLLMKLEDTQRVKCEKCAATFKKQRYMKRHLACHDAAPFRCGDCHKSYARKDSLRAHRRLKHPSLRR